MTQGMTKANLIETMRAKRAEWNRLLAQVPADQMTKPGAAGKWSVKDVIAHLTSNERWFADRLREHLRGQDYTPTELDLLPADDRNEIYYRQMRHLALPQVLADSAAAFDALMDGVEQSAESFLIEPQRLPGVPRPVLIWQMLRGEVYEHYALHTPSIQAWITTAAARTSW